MFLPLMFTAADPGFIKGGAPVYGVGICAPQKLKLFAGQNNLNGLAFYVDYIDQELTLIPVIIIDLKNGIPKIAFLSRINLPMQL